MVGGGDPSTRNFGSTGPVGEIAAFQPIFARSTSAITPSKKVQLTQLEVHYVLSNVPKMIIVRCPEVPQRWSQKRLKKVCYKVSLCENCQRQSCTAYIGLTIRAKMIGGGQPLLPEFWIKVTALERNCRFSLVATHRNT